MRKAHENTTEYILDIVAPVFNKKGYVGTSLQDITDATGLTKGAIYGNFVNKEDLALQAFKYNIERVIRHLRTMIVAEKGTAHKLNAILQFYSHQYFELVQPIGGCPIINVGVDSKHIQPELSVAVQHYVTTLIGSIEHIVKNGQQFGEVKETVDAQQFAKTFYAMIEGGLFMALVMDDKSYLLSIINVAEKFATEIMN